MNQQYFMVLTCKLLFESFQPPMTKQLPIDHAYTDIEVEVSRKEFTCSLFLDIDPMRLPRPFLSPDTIDSSWGTRLLVSINLIALTSHAMENSH